MPLFGSHVSTAGGLHKAVERATALDCSCIQVFTKNNNQWLCKPLDPAAVAAWKSAFRASGMRHPIAHASYLINLASPDEALRRKSTDALVIELQRCEALELEGLVLHPGAFTTSSEAEGLDRVVDSLVEVLERVPPGSCRLLLENTAGQGSCLGHRFSQLATMIDGVRGRGGGAAGDRVGICFDTCHALAAGYDVTDAARLAELRQEIEDRFAPETIAAVHLNDSKKPLGSRVDRHEHIGRGFIGRDGFRLILADPLFGSLPGYLETEKGIDAETSEDWDAINLRLLRELSPASPRG